MLKVLVAPLDWGLGHATRCIPIIKGLIDQHCTVIIAAGGAQKAVLQEEFPDLSFVEMPGFRINYGKNRAFTLLKIIFQIPKILIGIKRENRCLRRFAGRERLDLVISDNRYGLYGGGVISVFMTHQLAIRSSFGRVVDGWLRRINYSYIRRFSVCWVPDVEAISGSLGGVLSHPRKMPGIPVRYIGWLSRLAGVGTGGEAGLGEGVGVDAEAGPGPGGDAGPGGEIFDLLILLSGPEPQRSILEKMVLAQVEGGRVVLVRGLPKGGEAVKAPSGVLVLDYLAAGDLARVIGRARFVLARSGYSTVMDMVRMGKKVIYVPTPGQPEQEYLGGYLAEKGLGVCAGQRGFALTEAMGRAEAMGRVRELKASHPGGADNILNEEIARVLAMARAQSTQSAVADLG